jgi:hypothetical protein
MPVGIGEVPFAKPQLAPLAMSRASLRARLIPARDSLAGDLTRLVLLGFRRHACCPGFLGETYSGNLRLSKVPAGSAATLAAELAGEVFALPVGEASEKV